MLKINTDLPNLLNSKLFLYTNNDNKINLIEYKDFSEENKQYVSCYSQHNTTHLKMLRVIVNCKK